MHPQEAGAYLVDIGVKYIGNSSSLQLLENRILDRHEKTGWVTSFKPHRLALNTILLSLIAIQPVAAQSAVCNADKLPSMIEGFFQLTTGLGVIGLVIVWQADSLIDMFTLNPDQKKGFKRHKRSALKSAIILVSLGPLYTVAGSIMGLPLAQCVNLVPW